MFVRSDVFPSFLVELNIGKMGCAFSYATVTWSHFLSSTFLFQSVLPQDESKTKVRPAPGKLIIPLAPGSSLNPQLSF